VSPYAGRMPGEEEGKLTTKSLPGERAEKVLVREESEDKMTDGFYIEKKTLHGKGPAAAGELRTGKIEASSGSLSLSKRKI